jgi:hypothetical protein
MADTVGIVESALTAELARVSAKRERWLESSQRDMRRIRPAWAAGADDRG